MSRIAARQSPLGTIAQSLPRVRTILASMRPTWHMRDLRPLTAGFVAREGIRGCIWDVDGTLTRFHDVTLAVEAESIVPLFTLPGLTHAILSNADEGRYRELGRIFPDIHVMKGYRLDGQVHVRALVEGRDSWSAQQLDDRLAAGAIPLRKPDGELLLAVTRSLGLDPGEAVMIGDQYFTDIAGANMAGMRSIKVPAIGKADLPPGIRFGQAVERFAYRLLHGAPRWEPASTSGIAA